MNSLLKVSHNALPPCLPSRSVVSLSLALLACTPGLAATAELETESYRLAVSSAPANCQLLDKRSGVTWGADTKTGRLGQATLVIAGKPRTVDLSDGSIESPSRERIVVTFHPQAENPNAALRVVFQSLREHQGFQVRYEADPGLTVQNLTLLDRLLSVSAREHGAVLMPVREGLLIPADSGLACAHRFETYAYEGCHMEMLGLLKAGAAALVT